jgi:hypothetical protein
VSEGYRGQTDAVAAGWIPRQITFPLQSREDPGATAFGDLQVAADLGISEPAGGLFDPFQQFEGAFQGVGGVQPIEHCLAFGLSKLYAACEILCTVLLLPLWL